jgi:CRISPR-associated protein Cas2
MSKKGFYLVVYDISNDKRRTRLHKRLQDYGTPVQYSVFECLADAEELAKMKKMILRTIKPKLDQVRIYSLCDACLKKIWISMASQEVLHETNSIIV